MARRLITGILLCFCALLLMSYNTYALDLTDEVVIDEVFKSPYWSDSNTPTTFINTSRTYSNNANYSGATTITLKTSSNYAISAPAGTYFIVNGTVIAYSNDPGYVNQSTFLGLSTASVDCPVIDFDLDEVSSDLNSATQHRSTRYTYTATCRLSSAITTGPTLNIYLATATPQAGSISYVMQMNAMVRATSDTSLSAINTKLGTISNYLQNIYSVNNDILTRLNDIANNQHDVNQEQTDATNNSEQQTNTESNSSESDVNQSTQSLLTAGTTIIGALTSAPATDCNINVSTTGNSSAFTSAIGNLNLCSDVPSGVLTLVQGMVALVFTPLVLYYVYSILTLIYAQFKEYND